MMENLPYLMLEYAVKLFKKKKAIDWNEPLRNDESV